jgi:hypothetical protein
MKPAAVALTAGAAVLLAGCSGATRPTYYYQPSPSAYVQRQAPASYAPPVTWYADPAPRPRDVRPAPPVSEEPKQAELEPPRPVSRPAPPPPAFEPADACVGWWRLCHFY